jgi:cytochrome c556
MLRKFAVLTVSLGIVAGLAIAADDDETPTMKIMEKINLKHTALRKSTRTTAEFKKSGSTIPKNAEEVVKLAKEAREIKDTAEREKKPFTEWQKMMDDMIKSSEELGKVAGKPNATYAQAKEAFDAYNKTCAACHAVFKKDE